MMCNRVFKAHMNSIGSCLKQETHGALSRRARASAAPLPYTFRAQCHPGMEDVVAEELRHPSIKAKGIDFIPMKAGVEFSIQEMNPHGQGYEELYGAIRRAAPWEEMVRPGMTVGVELRLRSCSDWNHSTAAQQCVQNAIADAVRDAGGEKPGRARGPEEASLQLFVTMFQDEVKVFRDVSGRSMHRRGYRGVVHRAALNEAAAAGMLLTAGWPQLAANGGKLVDPMCGSGTLLAEAALMAHGVAPGLLRRHWGLTGWHDFDEAAWLSVLEEARAATSRSFDGVIAGCDVHEGALGLAKEALVEARVAPSVQLRLGNCRDWALPEAPDIVITNPPWGRRLGGPQEYFGSEDEAPEEEEAEAEEAWADLRQFLKGQCPGTNAWILSGTKGPTQALRMKASRRHPLSLGGVDCRLLHYEVRPPPPAGDAARTSRPDRQTARPAAGTF